jgi:hypothetical protein
VGDLLLQHQVIILIRQINLLVFDHIIQVLVNMPVSQGFVDIVGIFGSELVFQSLHDFGFDAADDFENWSLGPNPAKSATFFVDSALFDVLV